MSALSPVFDVDPATWDAFVAQHPHAHILQSHGWGVLKSRFGWRSRTVGLADADGLRAGALVLLRSLPGLTLAYVPKGPLTDWHDPDLTRSLLEAIGHLARASGAAFLKIEPELLDTPEHRGLLASYGFRPSPHTIQPRTTLHLDLQGEEPDLLARMKGKWRYNIRLAQRRGVTVRPMTAQDLPAFHALMEETGARDGFSVHSPEYYRLAFHLFVPRQGTFLLAEHQGTPLAAIAVLHLGTTAWYLWGASGSRERRRMPNHLLQWEAMRWARAQGAQVYDLWGIPDPLGQLALPLGLEAGEPVSVARLPVDLARLPKGDLWGVFRFKQGFGGHVVRTVGAWDQPYQPLRHRLYVLAWQLRPQALRAVDRLRRMGPGPGTSSRGQGPPTHVRGAASRSSSAPSLHPVTTASTWHGVLAHLPDPHVLQSWEWGQVKAQAGWSAERWVLQDGDGPVAAFQLLWRQPLGRAPLRIAYVPKGPVVDWSNPGHVEAVLAAIEERTRALGALFVKIDPDVEEGTHPGQALVALLRERGWHASPEAIQFRNTGITELHGTEEALLAAMKSKWRYNIRLATRRGIRVRLGGLHDLEAFYRLYQETGRRDGFLVRPFAYYQAVWRTFLAAQEDPDTPAGGALLLAEHPQESEPVAGVFLLRFRDRVWYFYGASSRRRRRDMPNHLLQWEAMRWARAQGARIYDWWGAPSRLDDPQDPLQGVWRFKQGFGARLRVHIGPWDWSPWPVVAWRLYHVAMPRLRRLLRAWSVG